MYLFAGFKLNRKKHCFYNQRLFQGEVWNQGVRNISFGKILRMY